jgi:hypothetical protein
VSPETLRFDPPTPTDARAQQLNFFVMESNFGHDRQPILRKASTQSPVVQEDQQPGPGPSSSRGSAHKKHSLEDNPQRPEGSRRKGSKRAKSAAAITSTPKNSELADYQMQVMLAGERGKRRLIMAHQEQEQISINDRPLTPGESEADGQCTRQSDVCNHNISAPARRSSAETQDQKVQAEPSVDQGSRDVNLFGGPAQISEVTTTQLVDGVPYFTFKNTLSLPDVISCLISCLPPNIQNWVAHVSEHLQNLESLKATVLTDEGNLSAKEEVIRKKEADLGTLEKKYEELMEVLPGSQREELLVLREKSRKAMQQDLEGLKTSKEQELVVLQHRKKCIRKLESDIQVMKALVPKLEEILTELKKLP